MSDRNHVADGKAIRRGLHGELAPQLAPLLLAYGKALFEVACKQTGVLGKGEDAPAVEEPEEKGEFNADGRLTLF